MISFSLADGFRLWIIFSEREEESDYKETFRVFSKDDDGKNILFVKKSKSMTSLKVATK